MTNEIIFYTQISSIFAFIVAIFGLYRLLVSQKDASIELLKEKNDFSEATPSRDTHASSIILQDIQPFTIFLRYGPV